jgi:hypothetical protein
LGTCNCKQGAGQTLDFVWSEGSNKYTWNGPKQFCNPYNCTNSACKTKGCNYARGGFCNQFGSGKYCSSLGRNLCFNETCPNSPAPKPAPAKSCPGRCPSNSQYCNASTGYKCVNRATSKTPIRTTPISTPHVTNPPPTNSGVVDLPGGDCPQCTGFLECLSNIGCNFGNYITDATRGGAESTNKAADNAGNFITDFFRGGNDWMPYILLGGGILGVVLIISLVKK